MERVCEELDEAKVEIDKLKAEYRDKAESSESFKKSYNEQLTKLKELSSKFSQQSEELNEKSEEASMAKQMYEELKCCLIEKESIVKHLGAAYDKLRVDCDEKFRKLEEENRKHVLALDEANEKNINQEQKIHLFKEEIEGLKKLLSVSQKKCLEAKKNAKASEELRRRDDLLVESEEQNRRVEDKLKWKNEQFSHLEEAHNKLRNQFCTSKKEWEQEISTLLDKIFALQSKLDSQTQISEGLQRQLQMCNQALAQEERQRKYLEIQLSESKTCFENVFSECQDAKSKFEQLSIQRDKEIAALRNSMCTKETLYKESDFRARKLEQENQELLMSLKELQEERIQASGASSLSKLRNKLKNLEHMHRGCSENLRAKEAQWSSQMEKLTSDLNDHMLKIETKDANIEELSLELEGCYSSIMQLKVRNKELELKLTKLEQDNQELQTSLQQLQEERMIHESGNSSVELLQKKVESLEQMHMDSSSNLRAKEAEWSSQMRKLTGDLNDYRSELERKDAVVRELNMELEGCYSSLVQLKLQSEEASLMVLVLKLCFSEAQLKLANERNEMDLQNKEREEHISLLMNKLEMKGSALVKARADIEEEREKVVSLLRKVESLELLEQQQLLMHKELERHKEMLEESSKYQLHLKDQALQVESKLKARLAQACDDLDIANSELVKARVDTEKDREKVSSLLRRVESLELVEEQQLLTQKVLERHQEMLEESSIYQLQIKEQFLRMESNLKARLKEAYDALDGTNSELSDRIYEGSVTEFELQIWKSMADRLKAELEENQDMRRAIEASLLAEVEVEDILKQERDGLIVALEEKDRMIDIFQQRIRSVDQEREGREVETASSARTEAMPIDAEKEVLQTTDKGRIPEKLQEEIDCLEHESLRREIEGSMLARIVAERTFEHEKSNLMQVIEEKEARVEDLEKHVRSLEQNFNSSMISFSSQLVQKQAEIDLVHEAWEKIATAEILALLEIEEKKLIIMELEDDIHSIQQKLEYQAKSESHKRQQSLEIETQLEVKQLEMKKLTAEMETKLTNSEGVVNELKSEKGNLTDEIAKLSSQREMLLGIIRDMCDGMEKFSSEDMQLARSLERIMQSLDDTNSSSGNDLKRVAGTATPFNPNKENSSSLLSPTMKKFEATADERSPFREVNKIFPFSDGRSTTSHNVLI